MQNLGVGYDTIIDKVFLFCTLSVCIAGCVEILYQGALDLEIIIREIDERDYPDVLKIWNNELGNSYFNAENFDWHHDRFKGNENYKVFVADLGDCVAGIVYIMQYAPWGTESEQFWIQGIGVKESVQGKGIGTKLLEHIEEYAKKKGIGHITLNTGFKRTAAHAFYERNGYSSGNYCFGKNI